MVTRVSPHVRDDFWVFKHLGFMWSEPSAVTGLN